MFLVLVCSILMILSSAIPDCWLYVGMIVLTSDYFHDHIAVFFLTQHRLWIFDVGNRRGS